MLPSTFQLLSRFNLPEGSSLAYALHSQCKVPFHLVVFDVLLLYMDVSQVALQIGAFIAAPIANNTLSGQVVRFCIFFAVLTLTIFLGGC